MTTSVTSAVAQAASDIIDQGYAVVKLSELDAANLQNAIATANRFFRRPLEEKHRARQHRPQLRLPALRHRVLGVARTART